MFLLSPNSALPGAQAESAIISENSYRLMKYLLIIAFILLPLPLHGAVFSVTTVTQLEAALVTAAGNGEDDTIGVAAGTYYLTSALSYDSHEDNGITIQGVGGDAVLDGGGRRVLFMRTYSTNAPISLRQLVLTNGYVPEGDNGAGLFINISSADLLIEHCQITNNFAGAFYFTNHGGGAYLTAGVGANVVIRNTVIAGNVAKGLGGGLYLNLTDGTLTFVNNTVVNNENKTSVVEGGGGIYLRLYFDTVTAYIYNNILWGNTYAYGGGDLYIENNGDNNGGPATVTVNNNDYNQLDWNVDANITFSGNLSQDPQLTSDFHLPSSSPCIDVGDAGAPGLSAQDFEGDPRASDGNCDGSSIPDMGADEYYMPPTLTTAVITGITSTTASGGGNVVAEGGHPVTTRGVCWSLTAAPSLADTCTSDGAGTGSFISSLTGLTSYNTYYVRSYGTSCEGTGYGEQRSFTATDYPTVTTSYITNIDLTTATGGGNVIGAGDSSVTARGICWSISNQPSLGDTCTNDGAGTGSFVSSLTGLSEYTTYYVRAYATNAKGTAYGQEVSFYAKNKFPWSLIIPVVINGRSD